MTIKTMLEKVDHDLSYDDSEEDSVKEKGSEEDTESNEGDRSSDNSEETNANSDQNEIANTSWVDSISKILKTKKPKGKKTVVLSKAKKLTDIKRNKTKPAGFEVTTVEGQINEETRDTIISNKSLEEPPRKKKRDLPSLRVRPNILEKARERTLQKIATKGVVQLFNAVKMQQKSISEKLKEAGPLEAKKEKVLKNLDKGAFLDVLMGEKSQTVENNVQVQKRELIEKKEAREDTTWSVLKDNFMMSAKMKDWDKDLDIADVDSIDSN